MGCLASASANACGVDSSTAEVVDVSGWAPTPDMLGGAAAGYDGVSGESACSYYSIRTGMQIGEPQAVPFLAVPFSVVPMCLMVLEIHFVAFASVSGTF